MRTLSNTHLVTRAPVVAGEQQRWRRRRRTELPGHGADDGRPGGDRQLDDAAAVRRRAVHAAGRHRRHHSNLTSATRSVSALLHVRTRVNAPRVVVVIGVVCSPAANTCICRCNKQNMYVQNL